MPEPAARTAALDALWAHHNGELRDPHQVVVQWQSAEVDPQLLRHRVRGGWWEALAATGGTLLVTREYEHLVIALSVVAGRPRVSYLRLPHPNGLALDPHSGRVYVASTRNPNLVFEFAPCDAFVPRAGLKAPPDATRVLLPVSCRYLPGSLYIHDLALIDGRLYANAVALNAIVELPVEGGFRPAWWPRCIDHPRGPRFERNYLQLNSIAAGDSLQAGFFSASAAAPSARRPGHLNFPVDRRGVLFGGATRDVVATGLTRPHSARLFSGEVWLDNSGYGEVGQVVGTHFEPVAKLGGWTRGLCRHEGVLFVGTSRVIPRYRHYAPGIDCDRSETGVHALDLRTGRVLGSLVWPQGNQIFALELASGARTVGFPLVVGRKGNSTQTRQLFFQGSCEPFETGSETAGLTQNTR